MNDRTQEIIPADQVQHFQKVLGKKEFKRQFTEIPAAEVKEVERMTRRQRRVWLAKHGPKKKRLR